MRRDDCLAVGGKRLLGRERSAPKSSHRCSCTLQAGRWTDVQLGCAPSVKSGTGNTGQDGAAVGADGKWASVVAAEGGRKLGGRAHGGPSPGRLHVNIDGAVIVAVLQGSYRDCTVGNCDDAKIGIVIHSGRIKLADLRDRRRV